MDKIVYTREFDGIDSNQSANEYLAKGWTLLHVGTKLVNTLDNGQDEYETSYVVGSNQKQYDDFQKESDLAESLESFVNKRND